MIPELDSWLVGLTMVTIAVLKILWGADLIAGECLVRPRRWRRLAASGAVWLGIYFLISAFVPYGAIGVLLLGAPTKTIAGVYAIPILIGGGAAGVAWYFLAREQRSAR